MKQKVDSWQEIAAKCNVARSTILAHKLKPDAPKSKKALDWIEYFKTHTAKTHSTEKSELQRQKLTKEIELLTYRGNIEKRVDELSAAEHKVTMKEFYKAEAFIEHAKMLVAVLDRGVKIVEEITRDAHCVERVQQAFDGLRTKLIADIKAARTADPDEPHESI